MRFLKLQFWISSLPVVVFQLLVVAFAFAVVQDWFDVLAIAKLDFNWFLEKQPQDIAEFYPNWYWLIFLLTRFVKYGTPAIILVLVFLMPVDRNRSSLEKSSSTEISKRLLLPFGLSLVIALAAYWVLGPITKDPFLFQMKVTRGFLVANTANLIMVVIRFRIVIKRILDEFLNEPYTPLALGITRIIFFFHLITYYQGHAEQPDLGALDRVGLPLIGWLVEWMPISPEIYFWMSMTGIAAATFVMVGFKTRFFLIVNAITVFYVISVPNFFGKLAHDQMTIWMSWIMAFSPCADALSVDAYRRKKMLINANSNTNYGFHLKVIWLHLGLIYFFAGFFKFWYSGFDWALSDSMISQVRLEWFEWFNKVPEFRPDLYPNFMKFSGFLVVIFELFFPFLIFGRITRWFAIFGGILMHQSINQVMYIGFKHLQVVYMVFVPWDSLVRRVKTWNAGLKPVTHSGTQWSKLTIAGPLVILLLNFFHGVGDINSYPFSIYPTYSELIPNHVKHFEYRILDPDKKHLNVWNEGKEHAYNWEHYSRAEYHIIRTWKNGLDTSGVKTIWKRWQLAVPTLQSIDSVNVFVIERSLDPDSIKVPLNETFLMTIRSK